MFLTGKSHQKVSKRSKKCLFYSRLSVYYTEKRHLTPKEVKNENVITVLAAASLCVACATNKPAVRT